MELMMSEYTAIIVEQKPNYFVITLHRPENKNSLNGLILQELHKALDEIELDEQSKALIIQGENGIFCTGMDFRELIDNQNMNKASHVNWQQSYMHLLNRFATLPKITISVVDGQAIAGGIGFIAASDLVIASRKSTFSLSETLWGLLPAMVLPYLIRKVGYQVAYRMTLTAELVDATSAKKTSLVDIIAEKVERSVSELLRRIVRLQAETIVDAKNYFNRLVPIEPSHIDCAIKKTTCLVSEERVVKNIMNFVRHKKLPWEKDHE
jgi:polyketide biosynthesis enoyl-CoA hydratase PksH